MTPRSTVLQAESVTVSVGPMKLLDHVDLAVEAGAVHAIVGPNGAGKSTLLRALTGELEPNSGEVKLDEQPLSAWTPEALARRRACLPQTSTLSFPFTIREVVSIGRQPHRELQATAHAKADEALESVGLLERAEEGYLHLSGGEKQRVHLARVLAQLNHPEEGLLLLDEPTASLDLTYQQLVFSIAGAWAKAGAAVLIVLHDLNQAMHHAHTVTLLHEGRCVASGPPDQVLTSEQITDVYDVRARWIQADAHCLLAVDGPISST